MTVRILAGDCRAVLATLPADSVHAVVTSPPYFGLRRYLPDNHPDKHLEIGLEESPAEFIETMVDVFRHVRRVLRPDGICWMNMGDSYAGSRCGPQGAFGAFADRSISSQRVIRQVDGKHRARSGAKPKDLLLMPARVAIALQDDGWWIRKDIIWAKPNPMPESASDRPTSSHEHVFMLTKSARYFWDADAVREVASVPDWDNGTRVYGGVNKSGANAQHGHRTSGRVAGTKRVKVPGGWDRGDGGHGTIHRDGRTSAEYQEAHIASGRNIRDVWTIATSPFPDAHFATFPPVLVETCIKASTSEHGCCAACGTPYPRVVEKGEPDLQHQRACGGDAGGAYTGQSTKGHAAAGVQDASAVKARILEGMRTKRTVGWRKPCDCPEAGLVPCTVLDPFGGSGTTALVADRLRRDAILIDLNADYAAMAKRRLTADSPLFACVGGEAA